MLNDTLGEDTLVKLIARTSQAKVEPELEDVKAPFVPPVKDENEGDLLDVAAMKALLKKKSMEIERQRREILDLRKEAKRLRRENERLQAQARMNSAATDALLEENDSLKRKQIKNEKKAPRLHYAADSGEIVEIFDSEDEEQDPNDFADRNRRHSVAPSNNSGNPRRRNRAKTLAEPSLDISNTSSSSFHAPLPPSVETDQQVPNNTPPFEGSKPKSAAPLEQAPNRIKTENLDDDIQLIEVKVRQADGSEEFKYVHLMKSEDGKLDIFNTDGFDLRPPIEVDERYNVGFTRTVISHAFRGNGRTRDHNWNGAEEFRGEPYVTPSRELNPALPERPGRHGIVFGSFHTFNDGTVVRHPLPFFCKVNGNDWRYHGNYNVKRWGEISSTHLKLLPPDVLTHWVEGALRSEWGKQWVEEHNGLIREGAKKAGREPKLIVFTNSGLHEALHNGKLIIRFSIMECVGYDYECFEKLVYRKAHPKTAAEKIQDDLNDAAGLRWRNEKRKQKAIEDAELGSTDPKRRKVEEEPDDGSGPKGSGKHKQGRAISVEV